MRLDAIGLIGGAVVATVAASLRLPVALHVEVRRQALPSDQVCSPHSHLNMRTVCPLSGLSMVRIIAGFFRTGCMVGPDWGRSWKRLRS